MRMADAVLSTRPWLAGFSGLILPGSGHVYVGRLARFAVIFGIAIALYCALAIAGKLSSFPFYVLALVGLAGGVLLSAFDAYRVSRKGQSVRAKWYQRWWMYVLLLVAFGVVGESFRATRESVFGFGVYRVPSELMQPTILPGEHILVDTRAFRNAAPYAGDVVVYYDRELNSLFIRRVAVVSGSAIDLTWDNKSVSAPLGSTTIPPGDLRGRVTSVFWSLGDGRIGKDVK
jgi:signal peptidase I